MEFIKLIINDKKRPNNKDPETIKYIGTSLSGYPNKIIEIFVVFWVAKTDEKIPNITNSIKVSISINCLKY